MSCNRCKNGTPFKLKVDAPVWVLFHPKTIDVDLKFWETCEKQYPFQSSKIPFPMCSFSRYSVSHYTSCGDMFMRMFADSPPEMVVLVGKNVVSAFLGEGSGPKDMGILAGRLVLPETLRVGDRLTPTVAIWSKTDLLGIPPHENAKEYMVTNEKGLQQVYRRRKETFITTGQGEPSGKS